MACMIFPTMILDMPCMKRVYKDKRWYIGQQPGTKSASRPGEKLRVNRRLCSSIGLHKISLVCASEELFRTVVFDALEGSRDGCVLREETRRRLILPGPPRSHPAVRRPTRPARGGSGFWLRQVLQVM